MPQIRVHEKALAHLSRGLYRSPASALRELVSNAWDANATLVRVTTTAPKFFQLSVQDNGTGFTQQEFDDLMQGGIGNSQKRSESLILMNARQVVGRLGIGMLGIAQICHGFTITSKTSDGRGFKARVKLTDLIKQKLDVDSEEVIEEGEGKEIVVNVGEYDIEPFEPESFDRGTLILADDLHPAFVRAFQQSVSSEGYQDVPLDWARAIKIMAQHRSLQELGDYWRLLWELSVACPVQYVSADALPEGLVRDEQARLRQYDFHVIVDGIQLFKPVYLKGNEAGYTTKRIQDESLRVYGRSLRFHGYIAVQEGHQIRPDELRGILIRIKDVAIGYYDPSLLDFRDNEGPRNRWITSEIYVDEGLEDALNIDRDSFNKFHPEFRALQEYVHTLLRQEVFREVYKKLERRSKEKAEKRDVERKAGLKTVLTAAFSFPVKMQTAKDSDTASIEETPKQVVVTLPSNAQLPTKKGQKPLASALLTLFEVATRERTKEKQRERFTELLMDLLSRW